MSDYLQPFLTTLARVSRGSNQTAFRDLASVIDAVPADRRPEPPSQCPTAEQSLSDAIQRIPADLEMAAEAALAAQYSPWAEASRGIPEFFSGGYAYSMLVDENEPCGPEPIRAGLLLQQPQIAYPGHAHDAEEFYFILSGYAAWRVDDHEFTATPGMLIHHAPTAIHAMETQNHPLLAAWVWRGDLKGRFWYESAPDVDCPRT